VVAPRHFRVFVFAACGLGFGGGGPELHCLVEKCFATIAIGRGYLVTAQTEEVSAQSKRVATAERLTQPLDPAGFPTHVAWQTAAPLVFDHDWKGQNGDPQRSTEVRLLWLPETLFLRFTARYRDLTVFEDSDANGRRDHLWDRDVVEVFLQRDASDPGIYKEFEISPNGMWIDLDVNHGALSNPRSGLVRRATISAGEKIWVAELAIPMKALTAAFDPRKSWRVNFFRIEGPAEPRFYSAWNPTGTPEPSFHVPEAFAPLIFHR
jgi:alpha-galactosidase